MYVLHEADGLPWPGAHLNCREIVRASAVPLAVLEESVRGGGSRRPWHGSACGSGFSSLRLCQSKAQEAAFPPGPWEAHMQPVPGLRSSSWPAFAAAADSPGDAASWVMSADADFLAEAERRVTGWGPHPERLFPFVPLLSLFPRILTNTCWYLCSWLLPF